MPEKKERKDERELEDRPGQAVESGEPEEVGRSHGHIIDEDGASASGQAAKKSKEAPERGTGQHWESGRQQASE